MALNAYLRLSGRTCGEIKGSVTQAGREDSIMIIGTQHKVSAAPDPTTGIISGKRSHGPFTLIKDVDKSTPLLYSLLVNNEQISIWKLQYWQPSATGKEVQHYTIELVNARICAITQEMLNNKYPENMNQPQREYISFSYQKIIWTWEDGGITAEDDWETPAI